MTEELVINKSQSEGEKTELQSKQKKGKKKKIHHDKDKIADQTVRCKQSKSQNEEGKVRHQDHLQKGKKRSHLKKETRAIAMEVDDIKAGKRKTVNLGDTDKAADIKKALEMKAKIEAEKVKQNQTQDKTSSKSNNLDSNSEDMPKESQKKKKNKKKKRKSSETEIGSTPGYDPPPGLVHEAIANKSLKRALDYEEEEKQTDKPVKKKKKTEAEFVTPVQKSRQRFKPSHSKEEDKRTIFIGNLSLGVDEKKLMKMFGEFGEIESLRRRCVPVKNPDQMKRVSVIKKEFHPERQSSVCFIKFKTEEAAKKALVNNGKVVKDLHIRVDIASSGSQDTEKTVFVANLPFDVEEELVRGHFEDCGNIENVRVVRDRKTCLGKGIGYVKFAEKSSVYLALKLDGSKFQKRSLRVQRCNYDQSKDGKKRKLGNQSNPGPKQKAGKFKQISEDDDSEYDSSEEPVKKKKQKGTKNKQTEFHGEKAKRLKKLKKKSNFKSSMSVFFSANNAPTRKRKSLDKITNDNSERSNDGENSMKHFRFGENDISVKFNKNSKKERRNQNPNDLENQSGKSFSKKKDTGIPGKKFHKKFADHFENSEEQHKNVEKFANTKTVPASQNDSSKRKHIHFD